MRTIKPLTSLRFFAAMMVLASHYWGFSAGFSGVTFFYVLSGYVLALNYVEKLSTPTEKKTFWWKRFVRIYPTHLLTLLMAAPLGGSLLVALPNAMLIQSWIPSKPIYFGFNAPSWSISDEAAFYAVFPFLIAALTVRTWRKLSIWFALLIAVAAGWSIAFPHWTLDDGSVPLSIVGKPLTAPLTHFVFYIFPPVRLLEFALGIGLSIATPKVAFGTKMETGACFVAVASVVAFYLIPPPPALGASIMFIPAAVMMVFVFSRGAGLLSRGLSAPPIVLLGNASFMLYMIHRPLLMYRFAPGWLTAVLAIGLSVALHIGFEKPVQRWLLAWANRPKVRAFKSAHDCRTCQRQGQECEECWMARQW
jgi:peptidoglycan/LPS O-acetylase OafA/YrhL